VCVLGTQPTPDFSSQANVQLDGIGTFKPVQLSLEGSSMRIVHRTPGGATHSTTVASLLRASSRRPKKARKGHEHCFRVDLAQDDDHGSHKYIVGVESRKLADEWMRAVDAAGAGSEIRISR
jgi:hypothetical protein